MDSKNKDIDEAFEYIQSKLTVENLQDISNKIHTLDKYCKGEGGGLTSGSFIDKFIIEIFEEILDKEKFEPFHKGESDMKICGIPFSFKSNKPQSSIALNWSKNKNDFNKSYFTTHIMILIKESRKWWKKNNNEMIYAGLYFIDKEYCVKNVKITSNNKTNALVSNKYVYNMLLDSVKKNRFLKIPDSNKTYKYSVSR